MPGILHWLFGPNSLFGRLFRRRRPPPPPVLRPVAIVVVGQPLAQVALVKPDAAGQEPNWDTTNEHGYFCCYNLPEGTHDLVVRVKETEQYENYAKSVTLPATGNRDFIVGPFENPAPHQTVLPDVTLKVRRRRGVVGAVGKALQDDDGLFHPLGITLFWAMQGWKHDRDRFKENVRFIRQYQFDYVRMLCEVGWAEWPIDPTKPEWADHAQVLGEVIDFLYDENGLRVELTIIGKGTSTDPLTLTATVCDVINAGRQHKIMDVECCNEYDVGPGTPIDVMVPMAAMVRERTPNLVCLSSPGDLEALQDGARRAGCQAFSIHTDRAGGDFRWRQVRQGWDFKDIPFVVLSNEPPGPASSVDINDNPLQLAMMRAVGVMCGGAGYVLHVGAMVTGKADPARGRPANIWEVPNIDGIMRAVRDVDTLLPDDVENWRRANTQWRPPLPVAPLQPDVHWPEGNHGVNRAYSALSGDGRVIQMPAGVLRHVVLTASYGLRDVTVYDPLTRTPVAGFENLILQAGQSIDLPGREDTMAAYIVRGQLA